MYIDLYDTSVVGCSNKTDRDSNSEYKKKCKPRKCLIYTSYWRRDRERLTFNFPIHYQYLTKSLCSYDTE